MISLAVLCINALVLSLYRSGFFSFRTMAEKDVPIVICQSEVWLVEAVGLVCRLLAGVWRMITHAFGVLFGSVPVEMMEGWWWPTHSAPDAGLCLCQFPRTRLCWRTSHLVSARHESPSFWAAVSGRSQNYLPQPHACVSAVWLFWTKYLLALIFWFTSDISVLHIHEKPVFKWKIKSIN